MNVREWALPVYTILIQLAAGALLSLWIYRAWLYFREGSTKMGGLPRVPILIILFTTLIATIGAHFHLSKPFFSLFALLNFSTSWLSREIVFTILFFLSLAGLAYLAWFVEGRQTLKTALGWLAAGLGLVTVYCMARVYMLPSQIAWNTPVTIYSYFAETLFLGAISLSAILLMDLSFSHQLEPQRINPRDPLLIKGLTGLALGSAVGFVFTLIFSLQHIQALQAVEAPSAQTSLLLLLDLYGPLLILQVALGILGLACWLFNLWRHLGSRQATTQLLAPAYTASIMVLVAAILGRFLFYAMHVRMGI